MSVVFDNSSESFLDFIALVERFRWISDEERTKLTLLAPFMNAEQRTLISNSLIEEDQDRRLFSRQSNGL